MTLKSILIVDDNAVDLEIVSIACSTLDCEVDTARDAGDALAKYKERHHTVVLSDYIMQPLDGTELIAQILRLNPEAQCLLMTGFVDAKANRFLRMNGLPPVIKKPIRIANLAEQVRLALNSDRGATACLSDVSLSNQMDQCIPLIGQSHDICQIRKKIASVVENTNPVVIEGPSGIGKLDLGEFLHSAGKYAGSNIVECALKGMSPEAIERDLISKKGEFGQMISDAANGTLILNNIETFPRDLQGVLAAKFKEIAKSCRLIILSDTRLEDLYEQEGIDELLFFELSLDTIYLPPLAERPLDIEAIIRFLTKSELCGLQNRAVPEVQIDLLVAELRRMSLQGNIGELMERIRQSVSH